MLLVFPVSHTDQAIALELAKWMRELGPYPRHDALIVWSSELPPEQREPIAVEFRAMGWANPPKAFTAQVTQQSWPEAPNEIFRQTADMVEADPSLHKVWYFFEPDNTPLNRGWLDALADEYNQGLSHPFLGYIDTTWEQDNNTKELIKVGNHMVGTGIYPPNLSAFTTIHRECTTAFDIAMAPQIARFARHTKLIHNNWRSCNYRWEERNGRMVMVSDQMGLREKQFGSALNSDVSLDAQVVHGCKDGSILRLLKQPKPEVVQAVPVQSASAFFGDSKEEPVVLEPPKEIPAPKVKQRLVVKKAVPEPKKKKVVSEETKKRMAEAQRKRRERESILDF